MNNDTKRSIYYTLLAISVNILVWHFVVVSYTLIRLGLYLIIVFIINGWLSKKLLNNEE